MSLYIEGGRNHTYDRCIAAGLQCAEDDIRLGSELVLVLGIGPWLGLAVSIGLEVTYTKAQVPKSLTLRRTGTRTYP